MPKGPKAPKTWYATSAGHGSDGFLLIDETGVILDTNPAAKPMLGAGAHDDGAALMSESAEERDALSRLGGVLAAGGPPAADVRRGYYLNIQV